MVGTSAVAEVGAAWTSVVGPLVAAWTSVVGPLVVAWTSVVGPLVAVRTSVVGLLVAASTSVVGWLMVVAGKGGHYMEFQSPVAVVPAVPRPQVTAAGAGGPREAAAEAVAGERGGWLVGTVGAGGRSRGRCLRRSRAWRRGQLALGRGMAGEAAGGGWALFGMLCPAGGRGPDKVGGVGGDRPRCCGPAWWGGAGLG